MLTRERKSEKNNKKIKNFQEIFEIISTETRNASFKK